jgi:hypothetical protein
MSGADFLDHQALEASGEDGNEGDLDESDEMLLGPVEDRVQSAVAGQPCEQALHLPTMMPLIRLDRRGNISRRIGHEGLGPPGQRKIDVTHLDQPDPASRDVGQSSP